MAVSQFAWNAETGGDVAAVRFTRTTILIFSFRALALGSKDWGEPDQKGDVLDFEMLASRCTPGEAIRRLRQLANLPEDATRRLRVNTRAQPREINTAGPLEPMPLDFLERGITGDLKRLAKLRCLAPETVQMAQGDGYSLASSVCKPRGGPKISRRRIASRKPEFDTSKEAISVLKSARLAIPKAFWAA